MEQYKSIPGEQKIRHIIWSDYALAYEVDWKSDLEAGYPDMTDEERIIRMYEINNEHLEDARIDLNIRMKQPIIVFGDLGLWYGRREGYKMIESGNIRDCLYSDCDMNTWYVDGEGDLRCDAYHHDGTNHYLYRTLAENITEEQIYKLQQKILHGKDHTRETAWYTRRLGDEIGKVYGWHFENRPVQNMEEPEI